MKQKMIEILRDNRKKHRVHDLQTHPDNEDVVRNCDKMWWHPCSSARNEEFMFDRKNEKRVAEGLPKLPKCADHAYTLEPRQCRHCLWLLNALVLFADQILMPWSCLQTRFFQVVAKKLLQVENRT